MATVFEVCDCSVLDFVAIDLVAVDDVTVVFVVETGALADKAEGAIAPVVVLDLAWKVGLVRALNTEKKLAKNGLCVDMFARVCSGRRTVPSAPRSMKLDAITTTIQRSAIVGSLPDVPSTAYAHSQNP